MSALRDCIGNIEEDRDNSIMEAEMASQRGDSDTGEVSPLLLAMTCLFSLSEGCCLISLCAACF